MRIVLKVYFRECQLLQNFSCAKPLFARLQSILVFVCFVGIKTFDNTVLKTFFKKKSHKQ